MDKQALQRVRSFNRVVTLRVGALNDSYLGLGRPLGQARLLYEIGPGGTEVGVLRRRLGLDSGYLSRLLRMLERQGLVAVAPEQADRRRRNVQLTEAGKAAWAAYDGISDDLARSFLTPLSAGQQARLIEAMAEVEKLLSASSVSVAIEPPDNADALACLAAYFRELDERFEAGFDPAVGAEDASYASGCFMIARLDDRLVGCGALKRLDESTAEIKRMWVSPEMRGLGVSRRLLEALEAQAMRSGFSRIRLDTNRTLAEAQSLYRKAGYREIERYNDNPYAHLWFEKKLDRRNLPKGGK